MESALATVYVLAAQPPCPGCMAPPGRLCAEPNQVHLMRTVRIAAEVTRSDVVAGALRVSWQRKDGLYLRWVADPGYPHLVYSDLRESLPATPEDDLAAWAHIEIALGLAIDRDLCDPLTRDKVGDLRLYGSPGALPPWPRPIQHSGGPRPYDRAPM